ncbi:MAG: YciI family protein [Pseudomonadota bacterium]
MQYLVLIYAEDGASPNPGEPAFDDYMQGYYDATKVFEDKDILRGGEALEPPETATSIRIRDGKMETMDGPFAETKERLGGFYLLDCENLDEAIEMAALIPDVKYGTIEIRPIMKIEMPD